MKKIFILLGLAAVFSACSKEKINSEEPLSVETVSEKTPIDNSELGSGLHTLSQVWMEKRFQNIAQGLSLEVDNTNNSLKIKKNFSKKFSFRNGWVNKKIYPGKISYTFHLLNEDGSKDLIETLLIEQKLEKKEMVAYKITLKENESFEKEYIPISIIKLSSLSIADDIKTSSSCTTVRVTVDTWCSSDVHYGYDPNCQALERGETYMWSYEVCEDTSGGGGSTEWLSGPTSIEGGGGSTGGSDGEPDDPAVIGDDPTVSPSPDLEGYLVSYKPAFQYPIGTDYATLYPKLTEYLRNKIPMIKDIPQITSAINDLTALSVSQIKEDLEWGSGPTIVITQLDSYGDNTGPDTVGLFDGENPQILHLDKDWVLMLENDNFDANLVNHFGLQANRDAFLFFLGTTVLHEYVHYGDYLNGNEYQYPATAEEAYLFETRVYGSNVNSGTLLFKNY